jgi:hypothetical protein
MPKPKGVAFRSYASLLKRARFLQIQLSISFYKDVFAEMTSRPLELILETLHDVMRDILENAEKQFVCPLCLISYSRADTAFGHCRTKREEKEE